MAKEITFYGKSIEDLQKIDLTDFIKLIPSRERRSLLHLTDQEKILIKKVKLKPKKPIKTHCRDMTIIPAMIGLLMQVHNGKEFIPISVTAEMLGHRLGEFALTRKKVEHSAPGIGATKSSAAISAR